MSTSMYSASLDISPGSSPNFSSCERALLSLSKNEASSAHASAWSKGRCADTSLYDGNACTGLPGRGMPVHRLQAEWELGETLGRSTLEKKHAFPITPGENCTEQEWA